MKIENVIRITLFAICFSVLFFMLENTLMDKSDVEYSWYRVQEDETPIDILILGNSNAYTSTNAEVLSDVWGKEVEIFSSARQNMEVSLVFFEEAIKYKTPEYVFLEINSACMDSKNILKNDSKGYLIGAYDGINSYASKFLAAVKTLHWQDVPESMFQLLRPTLRWSRWNMEHNKEIVESTTHGYRINSTGQSYATGTLTVEKLQKMALCDNTIEELTDYNKKALIKFLNLAKEKEIKVVLYKAPILYSNSVGKINEVIRIASEYENVVYAHNYILDMTEIGLETEDFYDYGHLNKRGAEEFTYYFGNDIAEQLGFRCDWDNAWGYKTEYVSQQEDGMFVYKVECYEENTLYKFRLYKGDEGVIYTQDWSVNNTFVCPLDFRVEEGYLLQFQMIPLECMEEGDACADRKVYVFMKRNACEINELIEEE